METQPDFRELLALFNAHHVEYLIVGGYALAFHGAPRFTGDLDIFVKPDTANAQRILTTLEAFGFASVGLTQSDFERPDAGAGCASAHVWAGSMGKAGGASARESHASVWLTARYARPKFTGTKPMA